MSRCQQEYLNGLRKAVENRGWEKAIDHKREILLDSFWGQAFTLKALTRVNEDVESEGSHRALFRLPPPF